jgi:uncharacterized sulfatase
MTLIDRRTTLAALAAAACTRARAATPARKPNFIVILADDLGYGDLGSFGGRLIRTPNLDRMARQGLRMTHAYASANICTPSRAGLLTGRYPIRAGLAWQVIQANDRNGLDPREITIPEALGDDYASALVGKWHLGHVPPYWPPTVQGFDLFAGLPYSHDMKPLAHYESRPGLEIVKEDVDFHRLTERFFDRGLRFVEDNRNRPFFLMLALTAPHVPLDPHPDHAGRSKAAEYGDVVEEVDAQTGRLLARLRALGIDKNTYVIVTSDNGPWFEGSAGQLRDRKGGAGFDGGYRVPFIVWAPGRVPGGRVSAVPSMNIDLLPTLISLAGRPAPAGVALDGADVSALWRGGAPPPPRDLILFNNEKVAAIRSGKWKYVGRSYYRELDVPVSSLGLDLLFDIEADPAEDYNLASAHPAVVKDMRARFQSAKASFEPLATRKTPDFVMPSQH